MVATLPRVKLKMSIYINKFIALDVRSFGARGRLLKMMDKRYVCGLSFCLCFVVIVMGALY